MASVVIAFLCIFIGLEVGLITWGGADNFWIAVLILSGVLSIALSGLLALANLAALRSTRSDTSPQRDF